MFIFTEFKNKCQKFIVTDAYIKKQKRFQINHITLHLELEKKNKQSPKLVEGRETTKIRGEIHEIETKKTLGKMNETKGWDFEKINKIDKSR